MINIYEFIENSHLDFIEQGLPAPEAIEMSYITYSRLYDECEQTNNLLTFPYTIPKYDPISAIEMGKEGESVCTFMNMQIFVREGMYDCINIKSMGRERRYSLPKIGV